MKEQHNLAAADCSSLAVDTSWTYRSCAQLLPQFRSNNNVARVASGAAERATTSVVVTNSGSTCWQLFVEPPAASCHAQCSAAV
jgi:hypothetical protein